LKQKPIGKWFMGRFGTSLQGALIPLEAAPSETGYANQLFLQACGRFRRTLFASQHGVNGLDVSVGHDLVILAGNG